MDTNFFLLIKTFHIHPDSNVKPNMHDMYLDLRGPLLIPSLPNFYSNFDCCLFVLYHMNSLQMYLATIHIQVAHEIRKTFRKLATSP